MKQLAVLSGKGGTGKTTIVSAFIKLARNKAFADCDVDAPNLHLVCSRYEGLENRLFYGYQKAVKYDDICTNCGKCEELCRFRAIENGIVNPYECEGCGVCEAFCPARDHEGRPAIRLEDNVSGDISLFRVNGEVFSSAQLKMGNGASGKLVTEVRKNLFNSITKEELVIIDGSPGIGCPVIASITGVDMVLIVAEPTLSGMHDMKRIIDTARKFHAICAVCINKYDINVNNALKIEQYCIGENIPLVGSIPFDPMVIKAVNAGKTIIDMPKSTAAQAISEIWNNVHSMLIK
ncbi:MAG: hypothetical protein PWP27_1088 [Clostridiales bacterium]|jgi:MinD superfamily P-loop ATPase|nr:hypothetical protein [Clostridiales bacterium]